jgi:hypothetical protein
MILQSYRILEAVNKKRSHSKAVWNAASQQGTVRNCATQATIAIVMPAGLRSLKVRRLTTESLAPPASVFSLFWTHSSATATLSARQTDP